MKRLLYYISLSYATFGLIVEKGIVIEAAPIAKWTLDKPIDEVIRYFTKKGGTIKWFCLKE